MLGDEIIIFNSPKEELVQALLNTCSVSDEAKAYLESLLNGGGRGYEAEIHYNYDTKKFDITFQELYNLVKQNKLIYFVDDNDKKVYLSYIWTDYYKDYDTNITSYKYNINFSDTIYCELLRGQENELLASWGA